MNHAGTYRRDRSDLDDLIEIGYRIPDAMRILVVHDPPQPKLPRALAGNGHHVRAVSDNERFACLLGDFDPELVLIATPDGPERCRRLRRRRSDIPIVVLVQGQTSSERTAALEAGADDSLGTPLELAELSARVLGARRRTLIASGVLSKGQ